MEPIMLLVPIAGMATGAIISIAFFKTVRHFIDRKTASGTDHELQEEISDMHARIEALEREQAMTRPPSSPAQIPLNSSSEPRSTSREG